MDVDDDGADSAAAHAARGDHVVFFEEGDNAAALKARCPWLTWGESNGPLTLPYSELVDFTVRFATVDEESEAWRDRLFVDVQVGLGPATRIWSAALPALGLSGDEGVVPEELWSRRTLRAKVQAAVRGLRAPVVGINDNEWIPRIGRVSVSPTRRPPFHCTMASCSA